MVIICVKIRSYLSQEADRLGMIIQLKRGFILNAFKLAVIPDCKLVMKCAALCMHNSDCYYFTLNELKSRCTLFAMGTVPATFSFPVSSPIYAMQHKVLKVRFLFAL